MAELVTPRIVIPLWRRAVVRAWIHALVFQEMLFPGSVDLDRAADRMAHFLCRVVVDG